MKKQFIILLIFICSISANSQEAPAYFTDDTCYCMMVLKNNHTERQKTMIRTPIFEVPCTSFVEGIKGDLYKQFFFFLHQNYREHLEIFKGDVTQGALRPIYKRTKEAVEKELGSMYSYNQEWFKRDYTIIMIDDFKYEKGKYYINNYPGNKLYLIYMQIHNYFNKGEEIKG
ncbi:hypothetical protein [Flavivirga rizhaonensis]|uniref:DUF4294 domain-containing protein n=1 Tax=Flavivirga rizhaonensis TaxID=2559571 RepID=A0A4S1DX63_9FLAO|nr:hypothetical protein [Flavivirga rizhaonensis]TGV02746.1 hypothetical protein EM932_09965 [Flavivirga rizhaonensis]